jgi:hypothetical protein
MQVRCHVIDDSLFVLLTRGFSDKELSFADKWKTKTSEEVKHCWAGCTAVFMVRHIRSVERGNQASHGACFRQDGPYSDGVGAKALAGAPKAPRIFS